MSFLRFQGESDAKYNWTVVWENEMTAEDIEDPDFVNNITNAYTHPTEALTLPLLLSDIEDLYNDWLDAQE